MARINTNIPALIAAANLGRSNNDLALRLERLATGLRINRAADDPAGLVVAERLRSEVQGLNQAISNSQRASSVIATTEAHLAEVGNLLITIRSLVIEAANSAALTRDEIEANQLQIDSAIDSINRISETATFAGLQLLDGTLAYQTSGIAASAIIDANIYAAKFGINPSIHIQVEVFSSAQTGSLFLSGNTVGSPGALLSSVTVEIAGSLGVETFTFLSGTSLANVVAGVNALKEITGVSAALVDPVDLTSGMTFTSIRYGSDQFVSVEKIGTGGDFFSVHLAQNGPAATRDAGEDVGAVVNGTIAAGHGLEVTLNTPSLSLDLRLTPAYAQTLGSTRSFDITGGGATFLPGPTVDPDRLIGFGIPSIAASQFGATVIGGVRYFLESVKTGQPNSLVDGSPQDTLAVIDSALAQLGAFRGRLGSLERDTIQTNIQSLLVALENLTASESQIRDADFAAETAALTRAQILVQAGTTVLATANVLNQNVLSLLT